MEGLVKCSANYAPLTPISFLERAAAIYRDEVSIIYESFKYTWRETHERCLRLASSLSRLGISRSDVVAVLAPNVPAMYELHFAVPMAGAVICTLNIRHNSDMISVLLKHSEAKMFFVDHQFLDNALHALDLLTEGKTETPLLVLITEPDAEPRPIINTSQKTVSDYETLVKTGRHDFPVRWPMDELEPISLNYTSGTTNSPKGVMYNHRGVFLNSLATVLLSEMSTMPVYLSTVPMFHCHGWCFIWGVAAQGGTNICLRSITAKGIFQSIASYKVSHMGGAPTVLNMIVNAPATERKPLPQKVVIMTGGAPPPAHIMIKIEQLGFSIIHSYGLTETYGPATICTWKPRWDSLPDGERAMMKSRQGLHHLGMFQIDVKDPLSMISVPHDGKTMGEVMFRGNTVMNGYFKNPKATSEAFMGGWLRTGDAAVIHADGYIQLKDRYKDIIISGGENISSIEVEFVLSCHPSVLEAAVVGRPDEHWGETVCAFVKLKDGSSARSDEIIGFCRERLPHYMAPRTVLFGDLPKTATGKMQKFLLREKAKAMGSLTTSKL